VDRDLGATTDLRDRPDYRFVQGDRTRVTYDEARFELLVGDAMFIGGRGSAPQPSRTRLLQNRPNPVRTGTVIRYELAEPGTAVLRIFDVRGRLVASFPNPDAATGRYDIPWTGADASGRKVSPGLYLYRLETGSGLQTRKLLVID